MSGASDLPGLDEVDWAGLDDDGGAPEVPVLLRALARRPPNWDDLWRELGEYLVHQGTCSPATAPTMPFLAALVPSASAEQREHLLRDLVHFSGLWPQSLVSDWRPYPFPIAAEWTQDVHAAVADALPPLLLRWAVEPPAVRYLLACLAGLHPEPGRVVAHEVAVMAAELAGTPRGDHLRIAEALLRADDAAALAAARRVPDLYPRKKPGRQANRTSPAVAAAAVLAKGFIR